MTTYQSPSIRLEARSQSRGLPFLRKSSIVGTSGLGPGCVQTIETRQPWLAAPHAATGKATSPFDLQVDGSLRADDSALRDWMRLRRESLRLLTRYRRLDRGPVRASLAAGRRLPLAVVGIGFRAPAHRETVALGAIDDVGHRFRGFPEGDRQNTCRERIEGSGMSGLAGIEQPFHARDCSFRWQTPAGAT